VSVDLTLDEPYGSVQSTFSIAVVMPVGPGSAEADRAADTIASIRAWEPQVRWIVLIDDGAEARDLGEITLQHPLRDTTAGLFDRIAAATLAGFGWVARETDADMVMKIDADALVIAPFANRLADATADHGVGLVGSYDRDCNGEPRSFRPWIFRIWTAGVRNRRVRQLIREARSHGYVWGEHALGCAVAVPRRTLDRLPLDDPRLFVGTGLGDDPVLGLLVRAAGRRLTGDGGVFAVGWRGLPDTPERLAERGYSIIHSVKNDKAISETEIRQYFAAAREGRENLVDHG
jgi:hypothetical protein